MICVSYTYGENYQELADIAIPVLTKYCKKHNYHWDINKVKPNEKGTYAFIRPAHARKLLDLYETVFMLEADFLITSMHYKVEDWLEEGKDYYVTKDINGVNTGAYICQATDWMKTTLDYVCTLNHLWDEQAFWETFEHEKIKYLAHPSINSILYDLYAPTYGKVYGDITNVQKPTLEEGNWEEGKCFVLHLPGMELSQRLKIFNEYKNKIVL